MVRYFGLLLFCGILPATFSLQAADNDPVDLANPLVGTASLDDPELLGNAPPPGEEAYTGFVWPGPALPHHDVLLNPINKDPDSANVNHGITCSYIHSRPTMVGFSSVVPGMTLMPLVGDWTTPPDRSYAAAYDKKSETASPGYYSVYFPSYQVKAELTTTEHTCLYRFTFPKSERSVVLMDLGAANNSIHVGDDDQMIWGRGEHARDGGRFFVAEFSKPFKSFGTFNQNVPAEEGSRVLRGDLVYPDSRSIEGGYAGCYLNFSTTDDEQILVKIATGRTVDEARAKLDSESSGWDFDGVRRQAQNAWTDKLNLIQIRGGTDRERRFFYSAF